MYPGISIVSLCVADVDQSSRFYERLGWRRSKGASSQAVSFFALNNIVLAIFSREAAVEDSIASVAPEAGYSGIWLAQYYGSPAAVDLAFDSAIAAGGRVRVEPCTASRGGYHGLFADPDGHLWKLAYNPLLELAADGSLCLPP